ncbi:hypothetical protein [Helicobacter apodemus]|uniref:Sugar transferase n=1 Tax=Helicobacter apodemus TaxID=135569 RepID=A0A2U8FFB5_9HELI|nr:hypothetical protein [Helicobacter apodemus]AWI34981.1 hypothetical protein CDV25_09575 [Helicobacter apodemus]
MQKYIVAHREDGLGNRINNMLSCLYLANQLGSIENFRFLWDCGRFYQKNHENVNFRGHNKETIVIGMSAEKKENIFSSPFIEKYFLHKESSFIKNEANKAQIKSFEEFKRQWDTDKWQYFFSPSHDAARNFNDIDFYEYRLKCSQIFYDIPFLPNLKKMINLAIADSEKLENYICIHIRAGDCIYDYSYHRLMGKAFTYHASCLGLVLEIAKREEHTQLVLVGDDVSSLQKMLDLLKGQQVICLNNIRNIDEYSNLELFFYDVVFMSKAKKIYGTSSAVTRVASSISPQVEFHNSYALFNIKERYAILHDNLSKFSSFSQFHLAFMYWHLYLYGEMLGEKYEVLVGYLQQALKYDNDNDKYRIHLLNCYVKNEIIYKAEAYAKEILKQRKEIFFTRLFLQYWDGCCYAECFLNYKKYTKGNPNIAYIVSRIFEFEKDFCEAMKVAIIAYDSVVENREIQAYLLELIAKYNMTIPKTRPIPSHPPKPLGASSRLKSHLSYKLGEAMILNSKSLLGYIRMPYVLSYIKDKHKQEQKEYQEKLKKNPNLKLPTLESYRDYEDSLKIKNTLSYKLGEALIKANSVRGGGRIFAYIAFFKEVRRLKRVFKEKKAKR